jgi:hypothetical protein
MLSTSSTPAASTKYFIINNLCVITRVTGVRNRSNGVLRHLILAGAAKQIVQSPGLSPVCR